MKRLRVALFTDADIFAGIECHLFDLARGLQTQGAEVRIACPAPSPLADKASAGGLIVIPIHKKGLIDREAIRTLRGLLSNREIDIVHAHNGRTALLSAIAVRLAKAGRFMATQHFLEPDHVFRKGPEAPLYRMAHRWVNKRTDHFIAVSEAVRQRMRARGDGPDERISVIPHGISAPDLSALKPTARIREELGIGPDTALIVCLARLEREKDIRSLVAAMRIVAATYPSAVCVVAGKGSQEQALCEQIRQTGLERIVKLIGFRTDVMSLMNAGDLFVLPSLAESFGLVLVEAMALGKPVVATRVGGPLEVVVEGETGLLVPPADPNALANAVLRLLADPKIGREMGRKGRERFQEKYTAERMARATLALYERVLS